MNEVKAEPMPPMTATVEVLKRSVQPPPDDSWYDWPFDDVLGQIYDWFIANLTEIIGVSEKIGQTLGQLLGLLRERLPARRIEARLQEAA